MRLTAYTDYAFKVLMYLAIHRNRLVTVQEIASAYQISRSQLAKVVHRLGQAGLLDTSRGSQGDPADDVTCLSINFLFFALEKPASWRRGLGLLWDRFWTRYAVGGDEGRLEVTAPFFAWRALVVCNPRFYPRLDARGRTALLELATRALDAGVPDIEAAEELFP